MARGKNGETLQAMEVNASSFVGIASSEGGAGSQVHLMADGDLIFHFSSDIISLAGLTAGADLVAGPGCTGITSTAIVLIS